MNSEAQILSSTPSKDAPVHPVTLGIHPGVGSWTGQFTSLVNALSQFANIVMSSDETWSQTKGSQAKAGSGLLCCGLRSVDSGADADHPVLVFVDESEATPDSDAGNVSGYSVEQRLEACANADVFIVTSPRMRAYVAGWVVQAGRVPAERDFIILFDAEQPASAVQKVLATVLGKGTQTPKGKPYFGSVSGKPAFLAVSSDTTIELHPDQTLFQRCVIPAENVAGLELNFLDESAREVAKEALELRISAAGSIKLGNRVSRGKRVNFRPLRIPSGGTEVLVEVVYRNGTWNEPLQLAATSSVNYPMVRGAMVRDGSSSVDRQLSEALAISFIPADSTVLYRVQVLARRGWGMVRRGEMGRVSRALLRRFPEVAGMVGNRLQQFLRRRFH